MKCKLEGIGEYVVIAKPPNDDSQPTWTCQKLGTQKPKIDPEDIVIYFRYTVAQGVATFKQIDREQGLIVTEELFFKICFEFYYQSQELGEIDFSEFEINSLSNNNQDVSIKFKNKPVRVNLLD